MSGFDRILVWGGGAIGGTFAASIAAAGHDVTLVDVNRDHIAAISANGLTVELPERTIVSRLSAVHRDDLVGQFDLVLLAVKADRTSQAAGELMPHRMPKAPVVSLQNGLCELEMEPLLGGGNVVGGFINFGSDIVGPGRIRVGNRGAVVVGEVDGGTLPRTGAIRDLLAVYEPRAIVSGNILGYLWGKQAYSAVLKSSALSADALVAFIKDPRWQKANIALIREILRVARAEAVEPLGFDGFEPAAFEAGDASAGEALARMADLYLGSSKTHSSAWRDLAVLRQPTDAAAQTAPIVAAARRHGLEVPLLMEMIHCIGRLERGEVAQGDVLVEEWIRGVRA
ncbi:MAG: ketopantoate reductase family protein [Rhizobiaceae bacterium]